jgi:hypothetical protein
MRRVPLVTAFSLSHSGRIRCMCVCVCGWMCARARRRCRDGSDAFIALSLRGCWCLPKVCGSRFYSHGNHNSGSIATNEEITQDIRQTLLLANALWFLRRKIKRCLDTYSAVLEAVFGPTFVGAKVLATTIRRWSRRL